MREPTVEMPDQPAWRLRLRLLYRAYRYRWRNDPAEIAFLRSQARPGSIAVDIGAHKGAYAYWLARAVGPSGHVYAFEPQPALAHRLRACFDPARVTVEHAGVSAHDGVLQLHVPANGRPSPGASLERTAAAGHTHAIDVRVFSLDSYFSTVALGRRAVSVIKCDVEGHELHAFRGAERLLREHRPCLMFECEQRHHGNRSVAEVFRYLESLGFAGEFFLDGQLRPLAEFKAEVHQAHFDAPGYCNNFVFRATAS